MPDLDQQHPQQSLIDALLPLSLELKQKCHESRRVSFVGSEHGPSAIRLIQQNNKEIAFCYLNFCALGHQTHIDIIISQLGLSHLKESQVGDERR